MTKNTYLEAKKFRKIPKWTPRRFPPLYYDSLPTPDLNEILSLVSWIKDCSNYKFIYIDINKLMMTNYMYITELQLKHIKKPSFMFQLDKQIKEELRLSKSHSGQKG